MTMMRITPTPTPAPIPAFAAVESPPPSCDDPLLDPPLVELPLDGELKSVGEDAPSVADAVSDLDSPDTVAVADEFPLLEPVSGLVVAFVSENTPE
jgi:hypothetical protein